jgi:competence protein ComEA
MRRREREEVAEVARRRLEKLSAELAGIRPDRDAPDEEPTLFGPRPVTAGPPAGFAAPDRPPPRPVPPSPSAGPVRRPGRHLRERGHPPGHPPGHPAGHPLGHPPGGPLRGWLADRLPDALRGRAGLGSQHAAVVVAVVGIGLAVAGWLALRSGAHDDPVPEARFAASATSPTSSARPVVDGTPSASPTGSVVVDVAGRVRHPGIVTLPSGSRVHDAIRKAGGVRPGTKLTSLNLARVLVDGEQVVVGQPVPTGTVPSAVGSTPGPPGGLVNINAAGLGELDTLPGVGPVTAQKILDWRGAHGAFSSVDELLEVDGIGEKTLADIAPHVTL